MNLVRFLKGEFVGWSRLEAVLFPLVIVFITIISLLKNDNMVALISAICGITYTIFAGKGRISCYFFGIIATLGYSYLAYKSSFWGNLSLNLFYYLPLSVVGIFLWKKHLKKDIQEIKKTKLSNKEKVIYFCITLFFSFCLWFILIAFKDNSPYLDSFTTVFSVLGMILTVKRCVEQWYVWFIVNIFSAFMWLQAYLNGINCVAIIIKWLLYAILAIYFLQKWQKELKLNN